MAGSCDAAGSRPHPVDRDRVAAARKRLPPAEDISRLTGLLTLLADPVRAQILFVVDLVGELSVGDLALALDASEEAIGYALQILGTAGLVTSGRDGRVGFYRLADDFPKPLLGHCLRQLLSLTHRGDGDELGGEDEQ